MPIALPIDSFTPPTPVLMRQLVTDGSVRRGLLRQRPQAERAIIEALADPASGFAAGLCQSLSRTLGEQLERMARDAEMRICARKSATKLKGKHVQSDESVL